MPDHGACQERPCVTPFTGAWIEIPKLCRRSATQLLVAPFTGAWIEIIWLGQAQDEAAVAPFAGAWIEIEACLS